MVERDESGRVRLFAAIRGWMAVVLSVGFVGFWLVQLQVLTGGERVYLLNTLLALPVLLLVWSALAITAVVTVRRSGVRSRSVTVASLMTVLMTVVTAVLAGITLLQ